MITGGKKWVTGEAERKVVVKNIKSKEDSMQNNSTGLHYESIAEALEERKKCRICVAHQKLQQREYNKYLCWLHFFKYYYSIRNNMED